jgi:hypothetical protein
METWMNVRAELAGRFLEIEQREMTRNPQQIALQVSEFLGLSLTQRHNLERFLRTAHPQQTVVERSAAPSLEELDWSDNDKQHFVDTCGSAMAKCGYSLDSSYYLPRD